VYAFGHDPANSLVEVNAVGFLIDTTGQRSTVLTRVNAAYNRARVSKFPKLAYLTLGSESLAGYLVGMSSATTDAHHNLQSFTFMLLATEVQT
jgi:hypothetical protein